MIQIRYNEIYNVFEDNIRKISLLNNNKKLNICIGYDHYTKYEEVENQIQSNFNIFDTDKYMCNFYKGSELDAYIYIYNPEKYTKGSLMTPMENILNFISIPKRRPFFYLIAFTLNQVEHNEEEFRIRRELAVGNFGMDMFFQISKENLNDKWIHILKYHFYTKNNKTLNLMVSDVLKELKYKKKKLFSSNQRRKLEHKNGKGIQRVFHVMLELIFQADLPICQFIKEIKLLGCHYTSILKFFKKEIIELNCLIYKIKSIQLNKNHQHILSIDKRKQTLYRNFKKLFIYSKIENYLELIKALSPIYSHDMETTIFIKSFLNDKTMYSNRDFENLLQDISWCGDIIIRVILIGDLDLIKLYDDFITNDDYNHYNDNFASEICLLKIKVYDSSCQSDQRYQIVNLKNKTLN
ncbi:hypothetical protein ACTA71_009573 [Dictyostelium dimigraforme]